MSVSVVLLESYKGEIQSLSQSLAHYTDGSVKVAASIWGNLYFLLSEAKPVIHYLSKKVAECFFKITG